MVAGTIAIVIVVALLTVAWKYLINQKTERKLLK